MPDGSPLTVEVEEGVALVTVARPEQRNALSRRTWLALQGTVRDVALRDDVRGLLITGTGRLAFASGADVTELVDRPAAAALDTGFPRVLQELEELPVPTVAAINGHALGGGWELALACDFRVAAAHAKVGFPEVALGIMPGAGGIRRLLQQVGLGRAKELVLTARTLAASEAQAWGLVNRVVDAEHVVREARSLLAELAGQPRLALRMAKAALNATASGNAAVELERLAYALTYHAPDRTERMRRFLDERSRSASRR